MDLQTETPTAFAPDRPRPVPVEVDRARLEKALKEKVRGEVMFDDGARALYATDASNYRQVPIGVCRPRDAEDVETIVAICRELGAPVLPRGSGTSLAGQCCNVAVVLELTKYMGHLLEIDPDARTARVQPGVPLDRLRRATIPHGLTWGPDPSTHEYCTLGGMIGNNSCGLHSVMAGDDFARTSDNLHALEVLTYDGLRMQVGATSEDELEAIVAEGGRKAEIHRALRDLRDRYGALIRERFPRLPRRVSGYNLDDLLPERGFHLARALSGTEGTCALFLEATLRLIPHLAHRVLVVVGYPSIFEAADHVPEVRAAGPTGLEAVDDLLLRFIRRKGAGIPEIPRFPEGRGFLLVEFGGHSREEAEGRAQDLVRRLKRSRNAPSTALYAEPEVMTRVWELRESGLAATARVPGRPDTWPGWEDSAVPPDRLGDYLRDLRPLLREHGYEDVSVYGHFGQGCVHCRIPFDLRSREGLETYERFTAAAADLVSAHGGSISGEHGDGQARADLLDRMYGPELVEGFREFKRIWDPDGRMNPGKVVDPWPRDAMLRLGPDFDPHEPKTVFRFPNDEGRFSRAALRCVGVGKCRREDGGTMCPSFQVTGDEKHSTRGRAHLLFESFLSDSPVREGLRSDEVVDALDLCLSCKGCKSECPMHVDVATYKAEFLSHYYQGRLRPRSAYAMGLIHQWSRLAAFAPGLVNFVTSFPGISRIVKGLADVHPARSLPRYARQTFRDWHLGHEPANPRGTKVLLWVDTWTNHFAPEVGRAAIAVLESAGFHVVVLQQFLCCGRPLFDFGMLASAKRLLREVMSATRRHREAGIPIVVLEPSCLATFRDEIVELFPEDEDARSLCASSFTLGQLLRDLAPEFRPKVDVDVQIHGHCHQKADRGLSAEEEVLAACCTSARVLDTGCCGMAGTFGYEARKYDVSVAIGEQHLLPAVRAADARTLIVADGFSCRSQIADLTGGRGVHLAQVLQAAVRAEPVARQEPPARRRGLLGLVGLALVAAVLLVFRRNRP